MTSPARASTTTGCRPWSTTWPRSACCGRATARCARSRAAFTAGLRPVVDALAGLGLLRESAGALCAFPDGFTGRDGEPLPLIVRKSDGGFGYAATDLAAVRYRGGTLNADRLLYVVGAPQRTHFQMVFAVARQAGWLPDRVTAEHIEFG